MEGSGRSFWSERWASSSDESNGHLCAFLFASVLVSTLDASIHIVNELQMWDTPSFVHLNDIY